jgi:uncharacterized protein
MFGSFLLGDASQLQAADVSSTGKHCLWRVRNATAQFYLLGSVHELRASDFNKSPVIEQAISQSRQFFFEIDPQEMESFGKKLREAARYPRGQQIRGKISPKTYRYLQKITISGMNEWQHLRPWAIAMLLSDPRYRGFSYNYGIDSYVTQRAKLHSLPTRGLETVDEHIHVFSDMHDIEAEVFLLQALVHSQEGPKVMQQELAAWNSGDTGQLYALLAPRIKEAPTVWWRLLDRRNVKWVPRIETAIKSGNPTMVVAGAAHFCGPHSVIAMLSARGYKVEQL